MHRTSPPAAVRAAPWRRGALVSALMATLALALAPGVSHAAPPEEAPLAPAPTLSITAPADGGFIDRNSVAVSGSGTDLPGTVSVSVTGGQSCSAQTIEDDDGAQSWACTLPISNGAGRVITATAGAASAAVTVDVLGAPTIDSTPLTTGIVSGTAYPGATVVVTMSGGASCDPDTRATPTGYWSCTPSPVVKALHTVRAQQAVANIGGGRLSSAAIHRIQVDNEPPAPPVIRTPAGDYRLVALPATFSGTGEPGASVDVSVDRIPVCSARVVGTTWACQGGSGFTNAAHSVTAIQRDAAGNFSAPSAAIRVFFGTPAPQPTRSPAPTPTPQASPDAPAEPSAPATEQPSRSPRPLPEPSGVDGGGTFDPGSNWGTPTTFGDGLPSVTESVERGNWWRAPLLAFGAILLLALPARLLASELRPRIPRRSSSALLRQRRDPVPLVEEHTVGVSPWLAAAIPFGVTVAFMVIADGVEAEVRYLRLAAAVAAALAVLNLVGVTIATRFGRLWQGIDGRLRFRPLLLVAAIVSGLLSRLIGLTPPFVTGTLIGVRMPFDTPVRGRAIVNLLQVGTVLGLGFVGWVGHSLVGEVVGFWPSLLSELFAALCLVGVGSTLVLLLPIGALPGRVLWEWHRWVWAPAAYLGWSLAFGILLGGADAHWPLAAMLIITGSVGALCVAGWAALRFLMARPD